MLRSYSHSPFLLCLLTLSACSEADPADGRNSSSASGGSDNLIASGGSGTSAGGNGLGGSGSENANNGSGGGSAAGGSSNQETAPCPAGSEITALTPDAGYARYGTVFGSELYQANQATTAKPEKIQIQVTNAGTPVSGCEVGWTTESGNGWVFPDSLTTDVNGKVSAYWTAGSVDNHSLQAHIRLTDGGTSSTNITGAAQPSAQTRTDSIHLTSYTDTYSEYKVRVTPLSGPETTYYEMLGFVGAYAGIQFTSASETKVIFSVWDIDGANKSQFTDTGACNQTPGFGGEGTGTSCRLVFPPSNFGGISGLPNDYKLEAGNTYELHLVISYPAACATCTDYTVSFSDITRGFGPISMGTQRYKKKVDNYYNDIFVEDWLSKSGDHCINAGARTAYFHDMQAKVNGGWKDITDATFNPNYVPSNNEICSNYFGGVVDGKFLLSSGGDEWVSRPLFEGSETLQLP